MDPLPIPELDPSMQPGCRSCVFQWLFSDTVSLQANRKIIHDMKRSLANLQPFLTWRLKKIKGALAANNRPNIPK
jgi:hypothetical protein